MRTHRLWGRLAAGAGLAAIVCVTLAGCGGGSGEKFTPVSGQVTLDGAPLAAGAVTFQPDAAKGNKTQHIPVGNLDAQGKYTLKSATIEGAPTGWYKITVTAQQPIDPNNPYAPPKHIINPKFSDPAASGFAVEVKESAAPGAYDFKVTK